MIKKRPHHHNRMETGALVSSEQTSPSIFHHRYLLFHKPYGVLSQFTDAKGRPTLADYVRIPDVYSAGRLDMDSEGLILLTSDGALAHHLTSPASKLPKTYWVQVERMPDEFALRRLRLGVDVKGKRTRPAMVKLLTQEPDLPPRSVPIRFRKSVPTAWLEIEITEGMNRQIRRMTAQVGHPALRLVRVAIGHLRLGGLSKGEWRTLGRHEIQKLWPDRKPLTKVPNGSMKNSKKSKR